MGKPCSCSVRGLDRPRVMLEEVSLLFRGQWSRRKHPCGPGRGVGTVLGGWWPRGQLASASLRSNISIYGALGHPVPPAPCSAGHGTRHGCPMWMLPSALTSPFWDLLGLYPQDGCSQPSPSPHRVGRMRAGCSEAKCQIQACHGRAWGTRQRGKTCSAESPGARPCRRPAGVKAALAAAPAREVAAALAGGRFQGPWALGLGWCRSSTSRTAGDTPVPPPPRAPQAGMEPWRCLHHGDHPQHPTLEREKPPPAGIYSHGSERAWLGKVLFSIMNHEAT